MKPRLLLKICCENIIIITYNISLSQKKKKKKKKKLITFLI